VTPRASIGSSKVASRSVVLRRPESRLGEMVRSRKLAGSRQGVEAHRKEKTRQATIPQTSPEHFIPLQSEPRD
jgi:hypothetical protein